MNCVKCGSYAINHHLHGRDGSDGDLCDVCYWRKRADELERKDAAIAELAKYFTSGNCIPVDQATIKAADFWRITGLDYAKHEPKQEGK